MPPPVASPGADRRRAPLICQLASGHSVADERILYRMALTAARHGYRSAFVVPHDGKACCDGVALVACPRTAKNVRRWQRWTSSVFLLGWALRSEGALFQIHDPDLLPAGLILKLVGRRVIYDVHDDYEASLKDRFGNRKWLRSWVPRLWWWFERNAARAFDGLIVVDRHLARKFARCQPVLLGNYPRLDFTPAAQAEDEQTFNLIYVGGVTRERGVGMALEALRRLPMPEVRLHVIGTGRDGVLLDELKADPRVVLHGRVPWPELHRYYVRAHVGLALYQPLAGFVTVDHSVKIVEYMAAGLPVLCADFPGLKAFVEDAGCGETVPPDDPETIAAKILQWMENPELRRRMGAQGRHLFESEYNWERHEHRLVELYKRVCGA